MYVGIRRDKAWRRRARAGDNLVPELRAAFSITIRETLFADE